MRVLIFHGYLLRGTGSNVYNANVAQALARAGHDVHLLCQDRRAGTLPWVDAVGSWDGGRLGVEPTGVGRRGSGEGSITAYVPEIGGLLPVYVADHYEGYEVKTFAELSEAELSAYIEANVAAVRDVAAAVGGVDAALANHLVMGPVILARAELPHYAVKVHGSALSYTVIPGRERFLPYASEGLSAASSVLVGSAHTAHSLWETLGEPDLPQKTRLGPPGVDVELFSPLAGEPADELEGLARSLEAGGGNGAMGRDLPAAAAAIRSYATAEGPRVVFVGKFIVSKGCDLLLAAWPRVVEAHPGARLLMVGFGEYRETLEQLAAALSEGDLGAVRRIASLGRELEGGERSRLAYLEAFLDSVGSDYADAARSTAGSIDFAGRLEYGEVATAVRASDAIVVPSTFPEAFGMVAAEGAAAGVLPVCARHSGLAEVAGALAEHLPGPVGELSSFELGAGAVDGIAGRLLGWLGLPRPERRLHGAEMREVVCAKWSWDRVAETIVIASAGQLSRLEPVDHA